MREKFVVRVQVTIEKQSIGGGYSGERLSVNEDIIIEASNFMEMMAILGKFHKLNKDIRESGCQ